MIRIAVLSTGFNRKETTIRGIRRLYEVLEIYNVKTIEADKKIVIRFFITDDGTDGTAEAILESFPNKNILIKKGTGYLYWGKSIRLVWLEALKEDYDFFFLLNDDVYLLDNVFDELLFTHEYTLEKYGYAGVYEGTTRSMTEPIRTTYGGHKVTNKFTGKFKTVHPNGEPQMIHLTNGNILFVHKSVVEKIGILYKGYISGADYDYGLTASKNGIPVLLMPNYSGICNDDHPDLYEKYSKLSFRERIRITSRKGHPGIMTRDKLIFCRRHYWWLLPIRLLIIGIKLFFPKFHVWYVNRFFERTVIRS